MILLYIYIFVAFIILIGLLNAEIVETKFDNDNSKNMSSCKKIIVAIFWLPIVIYVALNI